MRLALFAFVNAVVAGFFGYYAYSQGKSAGEIAVIVVVVLAVIQLAYVAWLVGISFMKGQEDTVGTRGTESFVPRSARRVSGAHRVPGNQTR